MTISVKKVFAIIIIGLLLGCMSTFVLRAVTSQESFGYLETRLHVETPMPANNVPKYNKLIAQDNATETTPPTENESEDQPIINEAESSEVAIFSVYPSQVTTHVNETFFISIVITNVIGMYGCEFKLFWNNKALNCTNAEVLVPEIWGDLSFACGQGIQNDYNSTHGMYWKALVAQNPAKPFDGNTTLVILAFKAYATGTFSLNLQDTEMVSRKVTRIPSTVTDGSVIVAPGQGPGDTPTTPYILATLQSESIKLSVSLSKNTFKLGEKINLNVTITNISNETILLAYSSPPKVDFTVYDNLSNAIFTFSKSIESIEMQVGLFLGPSESYNKMLEWDQLKEEEGEFLPVNSGIYYIAGRTGSGLCYVGAPESFCQRSQLEERIAFETPKIEIQIQ